MSQPIRALSVSAGLLVLCASIAVGIRGSGAEHEDSYGEVSAVVSRAVFESMSVEHQRMLRHIVRTNVAAGRPLVAACWEANAGNQAQVDAFNNAITYSGPNTPEFQQAARWTSGALVTGSTIQGDPVTLTYSFVPDGTNVPSGTGEPVGTSSLFSWLNGLYGSAPVWQQIYHDEFQRWGDATGITFVYEPNDDGASMFGNTGSVGVRGDIRIAGKYIDGNSGILAYNYYPNTGDMVVDANDSYFNDTSNSSRRLRNVIAHEMGHGLGMAHVCPISQTKLMEPYALTNILGPQEDDILNGQRHYGDDSEPNDSSVTATSLGTPGLGTFTVSEVSIDDSTDFDWFAITTTTSRRISVTLRPIGSNYIEGPQTTACNSGSSFDALTQLNLVLDLYAPGGTILLQSENAGSAGQNEQITDLDILTPGTYYIRVRAAGSGDAIQRYELDVELKAYVSPNFGISLPEGAPTSLAPDYVTPVRVLTNNLIGMPDPNLATLKASVNGGAFMSYPMVVLGPDVWFAYLPAAGCDADLDWYLEMTPQGGGIPERLPAYDAPDLFFHASADAAPTMDFFVDDFQTDQGWTTFFDGSVTSGYWVRTVPNGSTLGSPPSDADGSGSCYVTGATADLDGGPVRLISPVIDISSLTASDPIVRFSMWLSNDLGANPGSDALEIFMSDNSGANWTLVESYTGSTGTWVHRSFRIADHVAITSGFKFRLRISDPSGSDSNVEAGLDDFRISTCNTTNVLSPWAAGTIGVLNGAPQDILLINGSSGGTARTVTVSVGQPYTSLLGNPPGYGGAGYAMFARIGRPTPAEVIEVSPTAGSLCFLPSPLDPLNPSLATVAWTYPGGVPGNAPLANGTPTPWVAMNAGIPFPIEAAIQAVISEGPALRVTNLVVLKIQ